MRHVRQVEHLVVSGSPYVAVAAAVVDQLAVQVLVGDGAHHRRGRVRLDHHVVAARGGVGDRGVVEVGRTVLRSERIQAASKLKQGHNFWNILGKT